MPKANARDWYVKASRIGAARAAAREDAPPVSPLAGSLYERKRAKEHG
jgi:hypothetical protein